MYPFTESLPNKEHSKSRKFTYWARIHAFLITLLGSPGASLSIRSRRSWRQNVSQNQASKIYQKNICRTVIGWSYSRCSFDFQKFTKLFRYLSHKTSPRWALRAHLYGSNKVSSFDRYTQLNLLSKLASKVSELSSMKMPKNQKERLLEFRCILAGNFAQHCSCSRTAVMTIRKWGKHLTGHNRWVFCLL